MSAALYEQLADELGVSPEEAEAALDEYLTDLQARIDAGESVAISGLGTIVKDEGELRFTPSEPLQEAVNYRNTHLTAITVFEASAADEESSPEEAAAMDSETPADAGEPTEEAVPDLSEDWAHELGDEPAPEPEDTAPPADEPPPKPTAADDDGPTTGQIAGLIASVILLFAALGYVLTTQGLIPGFGPNQQSATTPPASPDTATATAAPDTASPATADEPPDATPPPATSPQGIDRATGGWTIVVASRTRPGEAQALLNTYRQRFRGEGLPTDILTGETNGQLRYRIAVGQYDTREAAMTARQQLTGRVPDDAWPLEIQPDS